MYYMRRVDEPKITDYNDEPLFCANTVTDLSYLTKISALQMIMGVWNWWGLEFFTLAAAYVSTTALAAQSVFRAISQFIYMIPVGLRLGTQIKICE